MNIKDQAVKNMDLSHELAMYIAHNPKAVKRFRGRKTSFVAFSAQNTELNDENEKLLQSVIKEGRKVIKAVKTNDKLTPWKFFPVISM